MNGFCTNLVVLTVEKGVEPTEDHFQCAVALGSLEYLEHGIDNVECEI